jgi:predicted DCC family thiol-disulfide oxidoreductase YuxK
VSDRQTFIPGMSQQGIVVFDGMCNLCVRSVRFILAHERDHRLRFAAAQSPAGRELLRWHGLDPEAIPSLVLVSGGQVRVRSAAALEIADHLRRPWRWVRPFRVVPRRLRDVLYDLVSRNRYRWFGRRDSCLLPTPELASRFLDKLGPGHGPEVRPR